LKKNKAKKLRSKKAALEKAEDEKKLKKILYSTAITVFILFSFLIYNRKIKLANHSTESIAKVIDIKRNVPKGKTTRQSFVVIDFFVGDSIVRNRASLYPNTEIGNCYKMIYVIDSPEIFEVDFNKRVNCNF